MNLMKFLASVGAIGIVLIMVFSISSFVAPEQTPEPSIYLTEKGKGFNVYRVVTSRGTLYVVKSTDSNPVAITK